MSTNQLLIQSPLVESTWNSGHNWIATTVRRVFHSSFEPDWIEAVQAARAWTLNRGMQT
jgi:hypothetical protein